MFQIIPIGTGTGTYTGFEDEIAASEFMDEAGLSDSTHKIVPMPEPHLPALPLPTEEFDGGIVVASVWRNDDPSDDYAISALLLVLDDTPGVPGYYRVLEIAPGPSGYWVVTWTQRFENIVPAVRAYQENGGDY